jgi:hypothetical protein
MSYDASEQEILLDVFHEMLSAVTKDGGNKRARGEKPPWWKDPSHEAAIWSHVNKWKHNELVDKDSGVHPLVHLAWRALAIAWQETHGKVDPTTLQPPQPPKFTLADFTPPKNKRPNPLGLWVDVHSTSNDYDPTCVFCQDLNKKRE